MLKKSAAKKERDKGRANLIDYVHKVIG